MTDPTNLWLIPASNKLATKNLARSMENEIDIEIRHDMQERGINQAYAWGAMRGKNDKNVPLHTAMQPGDVCLFYTADRREVDEPVKAYRWAARITQTLQNQQLADMVWPPEVPGASFELMYFLTTPVKVFITTEQMSSLLTASGEKYADAPKGFMRLADENLAYVNSVYGSPAGFLRYVLANYAEEDAPTDVYPEMASQIASAEVTTSFVDDLLTARKKQKVKGKDSVVPQRRSKRSKEVGDEAELYVLDLLRDGQVPGVTAKNVEHVADQKVGWDIQYVDELGRRVMVEVKGSTATRFGNFELTINELNCLHQHGDKYHFYLVGGCKSKTRKVQVITDMAERLTLEKAKASPITFRVELIEH
ncbi:MAG: DUF3883 domain-containing protein [Pseudomonadota bacterium]